MDLKEILSTEDSLWEAYSLTALVMAYAIKNMVALSSEPIEVKPSRREAVRRIIRQLKNEELITDYGEGYTATIGGLAWAYDNEFIRMTLKEISDKYETDIL